jgi:CO/xanthine dehydrogenase Mo-binding subunit
MAMAATDAGSAIFSTPVITRRGFVKAGGTLVVSMCVPRIGSALAAAEATTGSLDPTKLASWLEIRSDNTILVRTGKTETGTGMSAFYAQMVAEELRVRPDAIVLVLGDTDQTPDGGYSAGFLTGAENVRKVAAYTFQALLQLSSKTLGVPATDLTVADGVIGGAGKRISYSELVQGQQLELTIPVSGGMPKLDPAEPTGVGGLEGITVTGNPPMTPVSQYRVIGQSHPMPGIPDKVTGKTQWSCDVRLPGMLHARMVRPSTLGGTLIAAGTLDRQRFPSSRVVTKGNLVAVVAADEWEAIQASQAVAATTKWREWSGLPPSETLTAHLRAQAWGTPATRGTSDGVTAGLAHAAKVITATYEQPYVRHAPIGPYVAVADLRSDGTLTVWTHSSQSQGLRVQLAHALGLAAEKVTVRWLDHSGQYGRTTFGGDGAEADAAILSQLVGKPIRVQWMLPEDLAWSSVSPGWVADLALGLDAANRIVAFRSDWYAPHQTDGRLPGALLAGAPSVSPKASNWVSTEWPYDKIPNVFEQAFAIPNLGADTAGGGLRGNIMRTPVQRQQNFALESIVNEAAAAAGVDPIQFRLDHTSDARLIDILNATATAAGWEARPSPAAGARRTGSGTLIGRGAGVMIRTNAYWAGIAEIEVTPSTGAITVTKFTLGVDAGKVINPKRLEQIAGGGLAMGLGEALKEEVTFDRSKVTSTDWNSYRILTMAEMPEVKVVQISRDDKGFGSGGEAPNALAPQAVAAAFFDATGVQARRIPLTPAYVRTLLGRA